MKTLTEDDVAISLSIGGGQGLEFKRNVSSSVAREMVAFANAEGERIIFGIDDRNCVVGVEDVNRSVSAIQSTARHCDPFIPVNVCNIKYAGKRLVVADIPDGDKKPYSCHDGNFFRVGATSQKMNRDDFDEQAYRRFLDRSHINTSGMDPLDVLRNLGLVASSGQSGPVYNNAAVLFFGKEPTRFIRQAVVTCVLFAGTDKVDILDRKDFDGNIAENIRQAMTFLQRHLSLRYEIKSLVRKRSPHR